MSGILRPALVTVKPVTPLTIADSHRPPHLGPYRLLGEIGRGGMGVIYRGVHVDSGLQVAVKTVLAMKPEVLAMMRREIRALKVLSHPDVVRIVDEGVDGALPWYAMELLQGRTFGVFRDRSDEVVVGTAEGSRTPEASTTDETVFRPTPETDDTSCVPAVAVRRRSANPRLFEGLTVIRQLCSSLAFLHGLGIVHRDLKPANILIRPDGRPVLTDFGLVAQMWGDGGRHVVDAAENGYGTPSYMAPEQINGDTGDPRIDFYAVGCILYELVSGQPPFPGPAARDIIAGHLNRAPLPLSAFVDDVPPGLETLIMRLLEKDPSDRLGYADDVAAALDALGVPFRAIADEPPAQAYLYRPRMIGRTAVQTRACVPVRAAAGGGGGVILIAAESGAGKTTLATAVGEFGRGLGLQVVTATCGVTAQDGDPSSGDVRAAPLQAFRPLLQAIADRCVGEGVAFTRVLLGSKGRLLGAYEPAIEQLAIKAGLPALADVPADASLDRLVAAFSSVLSRYIASQPLLLILEDLQWVDGLSMYVLRSLAGEFCRTQPLAIIGTYRTEEVTDGLRALAAINAVDTVTLPPLAEGEIGKIIGEMLAVRDVPPALARLLARCSGGNPLFVREYLRAAVEERRLYREDGAWTFTADLRVEGENDATALPESLRGLVARRISTVKGTAASLLAAAATLGKVFEMSILQQTAGVTETDALDALGELLDRHFLEAGGDGRVAFTHDKIRECVDAELPAADRQRLHRAAGVALEGRWAGTSELPLYFGELAHHWKSAGDAPKAMEYLGRAGEQALATSAYHDAVAYLRSAIDLDAAAPQRDRARQRARWHLTLGDSYRCVDDFAQSREQLTQALALYGWPVPAGRARLVAATLWQVAVQVATRYGLARTTMTADREELIDDATKGYVSLLQVTRVGADPMLPLYATIRGLNLAERGASASQRASGFAIWRILLAAVGMPGLANKYDSHVERELAATTEPAGRAYALVFSCVYYLLAGQWQRCIAAGQEARAISTEIGMRRIAEEASTCLAGAYACRSDARKGLAEYRAILAETRTGMERIKNLAHGGMAVMATMLGQLDIAQAAIEQARALPQDNLEARDGVWFQGSAAFVALHRGDHAAAREHADRAAALLTQVPSLMTETQGTILILLEVYVELWRHDQRPELEAAAERTCKQAMTVAKRMPFVRSQATYWIGECELIKGRPLRARRCWEQAIEIATACDLPAHIGRAHLALAHLNGPDAVHHDILGRDIFARHDLPLPRRPPTASALH